VAEHILEVTGLSVEFHTVYGRVQAVKDVSFHLDRGETLAILGESGSGKSVSASAIMNLIDSPPGYITAGEIRYRGESLIGMDAEKRRQINGRRIAMIFQDPLAHLNPVYTVGWQIAETLTTHGVAGDDARARALELMERVGIVDARARMKQYPHQFSGGQRQRLMIAMALALKPDILIADEPTTALDVTVQAQILRLLEELQKETGMGLLLITHDLGVVAEVASRVLVMNAGEIVERGSVREVFKNPVHSYTQKLIGAAPGRGGFARPNGASAPHPEPLLRVEDVSKKYGSLLALQKASFSLMPGETLAIVGESGSGKSTLAKTLLLLEEPTSGAAFYKGRDLFRLTPRDLFAMRREIQMVFQDPTQSLNPRMTVSQLISEAWAIHPKLLPKAKWRDRVAELLGLVGLTPDHARRYPHQFSGGQRQRIAIARALALDPRLIICDEAVSALDVSIQAQVIRLLAKLRRELNLSYLFIAHDLPVVRDFADRVIVMQGGNIVETGTTEQIFTAPLQTYTRALLDASLEADPDIQAERRRVRELVPPI
jgi:peptide/nickel transport system ATP-binding protein